MCIQFIPNTHMFFTGGKDGLLKQWDADTFEHILTLKVTGSIFFFLRNTSDARIQCKNNRRGCFILETAYSRVTVQRSGVWQ